MTIFRKLNKKKKRRLVKEKRNGDLIIKPNSTTTITDGGGDFFNGDEKEVAKILQQLPRFIFFNSNSSPPFLLSWGCKRKRSEIKACPSPPPPPLSDQTPSSSCPCLTTLSNNKETSFITANRPPWFSSISKGSALKLKGCCKRKASKKKKKKKKANLKLEESLANSSRKQENFQRNLLMVMDDYNDKEASKLKLQTTRPGIYQQREDFDSNSSRGSFNDLESALAGCSISFPCPERREEGLTMVASSSLTSVREEEEGFGSESMEIKQSSESPYEHEHEHEETISSSDDVKQQQQSRAVCIPDLNLGPEENNMFLHFEMNKEQVLPLQMC